MISYLLAYLYCFVEVEKGSEIVSKYYFGMVSKPHDFKQLHNNIIELINLPDEEYSTISKNCLDMAKN